MVYFPSTSKHYTPNTNLADYSVGARDESPESEASQSFPRMVLASSSICSIFFRPPYKFCVPECHQKGTKSSTAVKERSGVTDRQTDRTLFYVALHLAKSYFTGSPQINR